MKVELIDYMGDDLAVVNAARVSFDKEHKEFQEKDTNLIDYLVDNNHWSPFSHCVAKFRVKAPIFVARQLAKHQVGGSWNEVSRRYVDSEPEFYVPEKWRKRADNVKQGSSEEAVDFDECNAQIGYIHEEALDTYKMLLGYGVCPEQARMVLPQSMMTEWQWTGSLAFWARTYNLRMAPTAQEECKEIMRPIGEHMSKLFPVSWEALTANTN